MASKATKKSVAEKAGKAVAKKASKAVASKAVAKKASKAVASKAVAKKASKAVAKKASKAVAKKASKAVASKAVAKKVSQAVAKKASQAVAKKASQAVASEAVVSVSAAKKPSKAVTKMASQAATKKGSRTVVEKASQSPARSNSAPAPGANGGLALGDRFPAFSLSDQSGEVVTSGSLAEGAYVLFFYPKADTPGCTKEACGFRDDFGEFEKLGVKVLGVSPDAAKTQAKFDTKYSLGFPLLADTDQALASALGVWQLKKNYGREYMGIVRSTFLVDAAGRLARAWRGVRVAGHVAEVLEAARAL